MRTPTTLVEGVFRGADLENGTFHLPNVVGNFGKCDKQSCPSCNTDLITADGDEPQAAASAPIPASVGTVSDEASSEFQLPPGLF